MLKYFIMIVICHGKLAIANHTSTTTGGINVDMYGMVDTFVRYGGYIPIRLRSYVIKTTNDVSHIWDQRIF